MISQPIIINNLGLYSTIISFLLIYIYTLITSLSIVNVCLMIKKNENFHFVSIVEYFLGSFGIIVTLIIYSFICYLSIASYLNGISFLLNKIFLTDINNFFIYIILSIIIMNLITIKSSSLSFINNLLFIMMTIIFIFFIIKNYSNIIINNTNIGNYKDYNKMLPILITSFSFQIIIPNIVIFLEKEKKNIYISIILGITLALIFFIIWNITVLNLLSEKELDDLIKIKNENLIYYKLNNKNNELIINIFSILVLLTSYIGINWGLYEFIIDAIKIKNKFIIYILIIIPSILISENTKNQIIYLLEITGIYGDPLLNGIVPVIILIKENKKKIKNYLILIFIIFIIIKCFKNY